MIETSFHHETFYLELLDCLFERLSAPYFFTVGGGNAPKCTLPTAKIDNRRRIKAYQEVRCTQVTLIQPKAQTLGFGIRVE